MAALTMDVTRDELTPMLDRLDRIPQVVEPAMERLGLSLQTKIMGNASGRPGPNVITGAYRNSWSTKAVSSGSVIMVVVGTNAPQGNRLEHGFAGADSRGRNYSQPPFPHVEPAVVEMQQEMIDTLAREILRGLK